MQTWSSQCGITRGAVLGVLGLAVVVAATFVLLRARSSATEDLRGFLEEHGGERVSTATESQLRALPVFQTSEEPSRYHYEFYAFPKRDAMDILAALKREMARRECRAVDEEEEVLSQGSGSKLRSSNSRWRFDCGGQTVKFVAAELVFFGLAFIGASAPPLNVMESGCFVVIVMKTNDPSSPPERS